MTPHSHQTYARMAIILPGGVIWILPRSELPIVKTKRSSPVCAGGKRLLWKRFMTC